MSDFYTIPEKPEFLRDKHSKGLVIADPKVLEVEKRRQAQKNQKKQMVDDINSLNDRLSKIETLLEKLLNK